MKTKVQQFLDYIMEEKGYSTNTLAAYRNDLSQFVEQIESKIERWEQVDRDLIIDYIMAMKADQEYASSTVARKVAAIKSFFHYLVDHGLLEDDPTATLDSPKVRKRLPRPSRRRTWSAFWPSRPTTGRPRGCGIGRSWNCSMPRACALPRSCRWTWTT